MNSKKLIRALWKRFPIKIARKYHDYVGKMVSALHEDTATVVVCLDVSWHVIQAAEEAGADLILSHHPFLYGRRKQVLQDPFKKSMYDRLEQDGIPVYSFHTNFDEGSGGMNDALAQKLGLRDIRPIPGLEMARMGELPEPREIDDFARFAVRQLNISYGQLISSDTKKIRTVGILGGAGAREYPFAYAAGCDIYISGDTPYHIRKELIEKGLTYLHLDHEIERIFIPRMKQILLEIDPALRVIECDDVRQARLILPSDIQ